jgi:hypothetical protein
MFRRIKECDRIAVFLCEHKITLSEAVGSMLSVADANPEWFAHTKRNIHTFLLPSTASDRDVLARYLFGRIEMMLWTEENNGEMKRSSALSARLTELKNEIDAGTISAHVIDTGKTSESYRIGSLPTYLLMDKTGKNVSRGASKVNSVPTPEEIEEHLKQ